MTTFRPPPNALLLVVFAFLVTACGSAGSTDAGTSDSTVANANAAGVSLGELETTSGEPFMFSSVVDEPTVVWFWGPG